MPGRRDSPACRSGGATRPAPARASPPGPPWAPGPAPDRTAARSRSRAHRRRWRPRSPGRGRRPSVPRAQERGGPARGRAAARAAGRCEANARAPRARPPAPPARNAAPVFTSAPCLLRGEEAGVPGALGNQALAAGRGMEAVDVGDVPGLEGVGERHVGVRDELLRMLRRLLRGDRREDGVVADVPLLEVET